ncbi:hypothetical protein M9H77_29901 [Catharanthus roseus]|uniref:Uncharacterized protein n=1 Tax=Catharanthus roseus TaxID=4058 RepID=A0ACB9ZWI1_CATRO|nr:hypothetical protein M9H77_29901 [Catharanthus roseus]
MLPVGYRFAPTDEELIKYYLANKVFYKPVPVKIIREIDATFLYMGDPYIEKEWFFFVYKDEYFRGKIMRNRRVEDGEGFWQCIGGEEPICNSNGQVLAYKIHLTYFSGPITNGKKTNWRMEEYRLLFECNTTNTQESSENGYWGEL